MSQAPLVRIPGNTGQLEVLEALAKEWKGWVGGPEGRPGERLPAIMTLLRQLHLLLDSVFLGLLLPAGPEFSLNCLCCCGSTSSWMALASGLW